MNLDLLRRDLERKFGRAIRTKTEAVDLEADIYRVTKQLVSYNTIRRFFGLATGGEPRLTVLNIYAQYLGYKHYQEYSVGRERHLFYTYWMTIIHKKTWTNADKKALIDSVIKEDRTAQSSLLVILQETFRHAPVHEWLNWIDPELWRKDDDYHGIKMFYVNALGPIIRSRIQSQEEAEEFVSHPHIVHWIIHFFVDYSTLVSGYFGYVTAAMHKYHGDDIFNCGMLSMRHLFLGMPQEGRVHLNYIIAQGYNENQYPILNSRYLASLVLVDWIDHGTVNPDTVAAIKAAFIQVLPEKHFLLAIEVFPIMALLGLAPQLVQVNYQNRAFGVECHHWGAALDLDVSRLALMIAYADLGELGKFRLLEQELQPEHWYLSYKTYQEALYAIAEIKLGRTEIRYKAALDAFPGLLPLVKKIEKPNP